MVLSINCCSLGRRPLTAVEMSWKLRKGTSRVRAVTLTSPLNFDTKSSTSLEVSSPLVAIISRVSRLGDQLKRSFMIDIK